MVGQSGQAGRCFAGQGLLRWVEQVGERALPGTSDTSSDLVGLSQPELVRTLSVQPPRGAGRIRLLEISGVDLQPCGGTHVASTGEIGRLVVTRVENKGRHNRRVHLVLDS